MNVNSDFGLFWKIIGLITQKGFSATAGILGVIILLQTNFENAVGLGGGSVGALLLTVAVVIEYLMWLETGRSLKERVHELEKEKKVIQQRLEKYDTALLSHLGRKDKNEESGNSK